MGVYIGVNIGCLFFKGFFVFFLDLFLFLWFLLMCGAYCSSLWFCLLVFASCFLPFAPCFLLPSFCFCSFCFLLSAIYRFCFLLVAFSLMRFALCVLLLLFAFCFYVFWTESKNGCNKTIAITTATITVALTKDSYYSNSYSIFIVTNTIMDAIITSSFPVANERTSRNNKRAAKRKKDKRTSKKINA